MYVPNESNSNSGQCSSDSIGYTDTCSASFWMNKGKSELMQFPTGSITDNSNYNGLIFTALRFNAYNSPANIANNINLCVRCNYGTIITPSIPDPLTNNVSSSAFILFLSEMILKDLTKGLDSNLIMNGTPLLTTNGNNKFLWNAGLKKGIYVMGKKFNNVLINTIANNLVFTPGEQISFNTYYIGWVRPNISSFIKNLNEIYYLQQSDNMAFFSTSKNYLNEKNYYFSNYMRNETPQNLDMELGTFIIDWVGTSSSITSMTSNIISLDSGTFYTNDKAGNFYVSLKFPSSFVLPGFGITNFYLNMASLTIDSVCGIQYSTSSNVGMAEACNYDNISSFICGLNGKSNETSDIKICCYGANVSQDIYFPNGPKGPGSLLINWQNNFPDSITNTSTDKFSYNFVGLSNNISYFSTLISLGLIISTPSITISNTISQEGAYSKVIFNVSLGREVVRNSYIIVTGDLSGLVGTNMFPRCTVSFNISDPLLDRFIENCSLNLSTDGYIKIRIGNRVVKCGISLPKYIFISIWPVIVIKDTVDNNYSVAMNFPANSSNNILQTGFKTNLINSSALPSTPSLVPIRSRNLKNLCNVISISPQIVNEYGDFIFSFDFSLILNYTNFRKTPNEVFIFFPHALFNVNAGSYLSPVACNFPRLQMSISCNTIEDNWLRISIPWNATLDPNQIILVTGVQVPTTTGNIIFNCSINNLDSNNSRTVLITGYGTFYSNTGINDASLNQGILKLRTVKANNTEPRISTSLTFVVSFETNPLANQTIPKIIDSNPFIVVTLPFPSFNLSWFQNNNVIATVTQSNIVSGTNNIKSIILNINFVTANSNKIFIQLSNSLLFDSNLFQYLTIILSGINTPNNEIAVSTGRFKVTISNSIVSYLYRGYTNLSTVAINPLSSNYDNINGFNSNNLIGFTRGLSFTFLKSKYIIDVTGCTYTGPSNSPPLNYIYLNPGKANQCYLKLRNISINTILPQTSITISIQDSRFKINPSVITFFPYIGIVSFWIGVPCNSLQGTIYASFNISDTTNYYSFPPIIIFVDKILTPSSVTTSLEIQQTAQGGTQPITFIMSDYTVDPLVYVFNADSDSPTQDSSSVITQLTYSMNRFFFINSFTNSFSGIFQITNSTASGYQRFSSPSPNGCFNSFNLTIPVFSQQQNLSNLNITNSFIDYKNADYDNNLPKNSLKFIFVSPTAPMYINCMLICNSSDFNDAQIKSGIGFNPSPTVQYFSQYFGSNSSKCTIQFNGLVRGLSYKMRCFGSSTEVSLLSRSFTSAVTFLTWTSPAGSIPIQVSKSLVTSCASFSFLNYVPDNDIKTKMINYCQNFFPINQNSTTPNTNRACIVCTESTLSLFTPGIYLTNSKLTTCPTNTVSLSRFLIANTNSSSRFLQNTTSLTKGNITYFFNVCPIQDLLCDSDIIGTKSMSDLVYDFTTSLNNTNSFLNILGKSNIPLIATTILTDFSSPLVNFTNKSPLFNYDSSNLTFFNLTVFNPVQIWCLWSLTNNITAPSINQFINCNSTIENCGQSSITPSGTVISSLKTNYSLKWNTTYYFWAYCSNNIPFSNQYANVTLIYSFSTNARNNSNNSNIKNITIITNPSIISNNTINNRSIFCFFHYRLTFILMAILIL